MEPCKDHGQKGSKKGYGHSSLGGAKSGIHRVAYCRANGVSLDSIKGLVVMHSCDNPRCIEPTHLSVGTQKDNLLDRDARGRTLRGDTHPNSKVTVAARAEIARRVRAGERRYVLAAEFGVSPASVYNYVKEAECQLKT